MKPIIYIGGGKGGVGKSKVSFALIDFLYTKKIPILVIETDTSNPDVFKTHSPYDNELFVNRQLNLDVAEGWIELVNLADEFENHFVIINSASRSLEGISKYSETLQATLKDLERELITLWVINRQRDSIELLRGFMNYFKGTKIHVLLNNYFGLGDKFTLFNESKTKIAIEELGGLSLDFPELADRVADQLYSSRIPIFEAIVKMKIGDRSELKRWRSLCHDVFLKLELL